MGFLFRSEFLGKIAIPLLKIEAGKKRWYVLKDKKLRCRAKGNNPKILLEMSLVIDQLTISFKDVLFISEETKHPLLDRHGLFSWP